MTWLRIGSPGSFSRGIRLKKCGVTARASLSPESRTPAPFLFAKIDMLLELSERSNPILELPFPIVPEFRGDIGPIARRVRDELFSIALSSQSDHFEL
jgi:hypothetical protein